MVSTKSIMKASVVAMLCLGVAGCSAGSDSAETMTTSETEEVIHEFGERVENEDGSITVYLDDNASFTVAKGTTDDYIEGMLEMFSDADTDTEETTDSTDSAEASTETTDESIEQAEVTEEANTEAEASVEAEATE